MILSPILPVAEGLHTYIHTYIHTAPAKTTSTTNNYNTFLGNRKKLCNMDVIIIPIVTGALGTVTKIFIQGLEDLEILGLMETIQTTALLRAARILRRVSET